MPEEAEDAGTALGLADRRMYAEKATARRSADEQSRDVLLKALEEHQPDLGDHVHDVGLLAEAVARGARPRRPSELHHVRQAAELHDIGKVAVPSAILDKPGQARRRRVGVHRAATRSSASASSAPRSRCARSPKLVRSSHERWDGNGYPDGLAGDEIPLGARIVSVCDAYDAMTSDRPYQRALGHEEALAELRRCAGTQFDPDVVEAFCRVRLRATADAAE